ncbi:SIR2 family NAD-dependent protein deacylase [Perlabentimonas gracilis]|uniref:SIR2 family NAD-dependent protein deacylase n=1 Tax=Perlabentimonas gracilis TaxID=2715279 RepID=UPI001408AA10|nr:NAD-dependent deacylase [Perlabentimonas gracilis]NHB68905.1 NAD-dependent deacylase [Perlabentimonas gracilis]
MKKLVVLTGAGISAESGIRTFRDMGGLWEEYDVMEVASIEGWNKNPALVQRFYNDRRKQLYTVEPNPGHIALAQAEKDFEVHIITQNVDNLHERAGSTQIIHLHGELTKAQSTGDPNIIYDIGNRELKIGDVCEQGHQLRPHIVWFGEPVPMIAQAAEVAAQADIFAVVGTSLNVYPAAGLLDYAPMGIPIFLIDPHDVAVYSRRDVTFIKEPASTGVKKMLEMLNQME